MNFLNRLSSGNICRRKSCKHHTLQQEDKSKESSPFSGDSTGKGMPLFTCIVYIIKDVRSENFDR
jgi:hypothetical protein